MAWRVAFWTVARGAGLLASPAATHGAAPRARNYPGEVFSNRASAQKGGTPRFCTTRNRAGLRGLEAAETGGFLRKCADTRL